MVSGRVEGALTKCLLLGRCAKDIFGYLYCRFLNDS